MNNSTQSAPVGVLSSVVDRHGRLAAWVGEMAALTQPDQIHWVDGSEAEYGKLTDELVEAGTLVRLNEEKFPNSFAAFSDPRDVARVEERTYICFEHERDAGFTNNWMAPARMVTDTKVG